MAEPLPELAQDGRPIWERIAELAAKLPGWPTCQHAEDGMDRAEWCLACLRRKNEDLERRLAESEASRAAIRKLCQCLLFEHVEMTGDGICPGCGKQEHDCPPSEFGEDNTEFLAFWRNRVAEAFAPDAGRALLVELDAWRMYGCYAASCARSGEHNVMSFDEFQKDREARKACET